MEQKSNMKIVVIEKSTLGESKIDNRMSQNEIWNANRSVVGAQHPNQ